MRLLYVRIGLVHALQAIEFDKVKESLANYCDTPLGRDKVQSLTPSFDEETVWSELEKTAQALSLIGQVQITLFGLAPVSEAVTRAKKQGCLDAATLWLIGRTLKVLRIAKSGVKTKKDAHPRIWTLVDRFIEAPATETKILNGLDADGTVLDEASPGLKAARQQVIAITKRITDKMHSFISGKSRELLSDAVVTQRSGRYVIPLKSDNRGKIKGIVHDTSASGQTVYIEPEEVVQLGNQLREAEAKEREEVQKVLDDLSSRVAEVADEILGSLTAAEEFDVLLAKARFAATNKACVPERRNPGYIKLKTARHPLIPSGMVVPLDFTIGNEHQCVLITGPNTGGKTIAIKAIGLAVAMVQSGILPFAEKMELGVFSQLWADIGDEQSLQQSLSTFSGHIKNIATAIKALKPNALVLFDEIGAGTDPAEGARLARAILLFMQEAEAKIVASTHYGELKIFASNAPGFINASMEFDAKSLRPTYRFQFGIPGSSHALKIAEIHGIPRSVIDKAKEGTSDDDLDVAKMIEKLEIAQRLAHRAQGDADRLANKVKELEQQAEEKIAKAEESRSRARQDASEEILVAISTIKQQAEEVFQSFNRASTQKDIDDARTKIKEVLSEGTKKANELAPTKKNPIRPQSVVNKGDAVRIVGHSQHGTVIDDPKSGKVTIQLGSIKMKVSLSDIESVAQQKVTPKRSKTSSMRLQKGLTADREIHLRRQRAEEAMETLERFIDDAVLAGLPSVRIVHGKGEGVLRKLSQELLRKNPHVKRYHEAPPAQGGQGVTIAEFE